MAQDKKFAAFVGVFTNKMESDLLVKTPTKAKKSKLGLEEYTISGHVNKDDFHQIFIRFTPVDEKKRVLPNFTLFETTQSSWQADEVNLSLKFAYHKADGSSFWSSSIAKYSAVSRCRLRRVRE